MNLLLLYPSEVKGGEVVLRGERAQEVRTRHGLAAGLSLCCGIRDGQIGQALISRVGPDEVVLTISCGDEPPPRRPVTIIVAVPRPPMVRRIITLATVFGIEALWFLRSANVEKSYLDSHMLQPTAIEGSILDGLEQARDTRAPRIEVFPRFRPFMEDVLPARHPISSDSLRILGDERAEQSLAQCALSPGVASAIVAIGPEKGWNDFERETFVRSGFRPVSLGARSLRVEHAAAALIAQIMLLQDCSSQLSRDLSQEAIADREKSR